MPSGRKPSVRYWDSRSAYCCWIDGTQHTLAVGPDDAPTGPTYLDALARFSKLLALEADKGTDDYLVSALLNQYRIHLHATRKSSAPGIFDVMARGFAAKFGSKRVCELTPHEVEQWLGAQNNWNNTSKAHAGTLILAAVSWARKKKLIKTDPLAGCVDLPEPVLRGREARMSEELMDLLIAEAHANKMKSREFGNFLWLLRATGARPGELRQAEAFNYEGGKLVFRWNARKGYVHKTAIKTKRDRVIFLALDIKEYVEGLVAKHPKGPLFLTPRGATWTLPALSNKWTWLLQRKKVIAYCKRHDIEIKTLKPYNFRHTWISTYLDATGDYYGCAAMCGTSIKMLERRYSHPDVDNLHQRYLAFMASRQMLGTGDEK